MSGRGAAAALLLTAALSTPLGAAPADPDEVLRVVREAHAAVKGGRPEVARRGYLEAAARVPEVRDWLLLRAAAATADSSVRAQLYAELRSPVARGRVTATEAGVRERVGDWTAAAVRYDSLGRAADAFRARLQAAGSPDERSAARSRLMAALEDETDPVRARELGDALLAASPTLSPGDALVVARTARLARLPARSAAWYPGAFAAGLGSAEDRLAFASALADLGRHREAVAAFDRVGGPPATSAEARYRRARSQLRLGDRTGAGASLWQVVERHPREREVVARALLLAGELAREDGRPEEARRIWLDLARRDPSGNETPRARFLAALVAYEDGRFARAAGEWAAIGLDFPASATAAAARFWSGRAWSASGASQQADDAWRSVLERDSLSYYAVVSARRLGIPAWRPAEAPDRFDQIAALDSAMARLPVLRRLELTLEAGWEREWLVRSATTPEQIMATADAFRRDGQTALAARLARQGLAGGSPTDARAYRLLYPLPTGNDLQRLAAGTGIDPALVAALVRQESSWEPRATSSAGARGLMQLMPATAEPLARRLGMTGWHPDRLYDPEVNLRLGITFLGDVLRRFDGDTVRTLAAYNAGPARVRRWVSGIGSDDPELLVERITFAETRDYVRQVLRNLSLYGALYGDPV